MRKFLIFAALCCISYLSDAQVIVRSQKDRGVTTVSSTVITKTKRSYAKYDAKVGYQQFVELGSKSLVKQEKGATGINYIGGWRFNNWFYAGVGTGLNFSHYAHKGVKEHVGESVQGSGTGWLYDYNKSIDSHHAGIYECFGISDTDGMGSLNAVSVPLYLHLRGYYMRTRWAPYSAVSFGGDFAPKECGVYFDFSTGVDFRLNDKYHLYSSLGFWFKGGRDMVFYNTDANGHYYEDYTFYSEYDEYEKCNFDNCSLSGSEYGHYHIIFENLWMAKRLFAGMSFRIGVSF